MKKFLAILLAAGLVASLSGFTAKDDPAEVYEQATAKSLEAGSQQMDCDMTMTLRYGAQTLEIGMDFDAQVVRDGEGYQMAMTGSLDLLGQQLPMELYYLDNWCYMDVLGQKVKTRMPLDQMLALTGAQASALSPVPYMEKLTLEPQGEQAQLTYRIPQAAMIRYFEDVLAATGPALTPEEQAQLELVKLGSMDGTLVVDGEYNTLSEEARMNLFLYVGEDVFPCTLRMAVDYSPLAAGTQLQFPADLASYPTEEQLAAQVAAQQAAAQPAA